MSSGELICSSELGPCSSGGRPTLLQSKCLHQVFPPLVKGADIRGKGKKLRVFLYASDFARICNQV
jgi:hypothetical protein